jgi:hypothetical protein
MNYLSQRVAADTADSTRLFKACIVVVCGWALIELPLDLSGSIDITSVLAVLVSKVLVCSIGAAALVNFRYASEVFSFVCASSVLAIVPALPLEYAHYMPIALVSTIECIAKAVCVVVFLIASLVKNSIEIDQQLSKRAAEDEL